MFAVRLPAELVEAIDEALEREGVTKTVLAERALERELDRIASGGRG